MKIVLLQFDPAKYPSPSSTHPRILKLVALEIASTLAALFNYSLAVGE